MRIGDTARGAENAKKLIALPPDAAEHSQLLKNHGPGDNGEEQENAEHNARDQSRLGENAGDIGRKNSCEEKNDALLSDYRNFSGRLKT